MSEFIKVRKDGQIIEIHPLGLAGHQALGWEVVPDEPVTEQPAEEQKAEAPAPKSRKRGA